MRCRDTFVSSHDFFPAILWMSVAVAAGNDIALLAGAFAPPGDRSALPCGPPDLEAAKSAAELVGAAAVALFLLVVVLLLLVRVLRARKAPADDGHGDDTSADDDATTANRGARSALGATAFVGVAALFLAFVLDAASFSMEPPVPVPTQTADASISVATMAFDGSPVSSDGSVATCGPEAAHQFDGRLAANPGANVEIFVVSHVREGRYYVQGALPVGQDGRWSMTVYVNEDRCFYRTPVWLMLVTATGSVARTLRDHVADPEVEDREPIGALDWQLVDRLRVHKLPDGFVPFACWSAW
jgi:hypothetical protein